MDALEASNKQVKDVPPVPLKTYQWEDIKRARRKGGYPWTYLDKRPLEDNLLEDLIPYYRKDNLRKTQSAFEMAGRNIQKEAKEDTLIVESNDNSADVSISEYLDKDDAPGPSKPPGKSDTMTSQRAKSEEPGRKRKHSIESSHSGISKYSLSRIGFLRKLKEAKSKLKLHKLFSFTKSDTKIVDTSKTSEETLPKKITKHETTKQSKVEGSVYIHIPLKPPPGETDEFSYLEFEGRTNPSPIPEESKENMPESPIENGTDVQLIILTAPSDDEILDTAPVAETPICAENPFFESKGMDELKTLARDVVSKYSPETQRKMLNPTAIPESKKEPNKDNDEKEKSPMDGTSAIHEPSKEEPVATEEKGAKKKKKLKAKSNAQDDDQILEAQKTDDDKIEEQVILQKPQVSKETNKQLIIDDEDGLKTETVSSPTMDDTVRQPGKESPLLRKKVSFKKRSKEESDGIYEEVQVTTEVVKKEDNSEDDAASNVATTPTANLLIDEQETKLHKDRVQGMTVAEEYEYWCRVNSNDYEPITPPEHGFVPIAEGRPKKPGTPVTDSDIEFLASKVTDIELRTTGIIKITNADDKSGSVFVPLESVLKLDPQPEKETKEESHGHKIQEAIHKQASNLKRQASIISKKAGDQAEKLQTRVKSIKRPKIKMPSAPKFEKPALPKLKLEKPKLSKLKKMPNVRIPEKMRNISLSLPRRGKRANREPTSTESTAGDSDKRNIFDFSTYPRIFRRKRREDDGDNLQTPRTGTDITPDSEKTTLPRFKFTTRWKGKFTRKPPASSRINETIDTVNSSKSKDSERSNTQESSRIPLHSEDSIDHENLDLQLREEREDSVERRMRMASTRYDEDIEMHDAYLKENQEIHRASSMNAKYNSDRWNHGIFHETDTHTNGVADKPVSILKKKMENIPSSSSDDIHRRGVLEEINSDEFFLRQKGISQDNIDVGAYLSSEIREAFRTPNNALSQLETAQPEAPKRKAMKKPKRKKTPHVSQEGIQYDLESYHYEPEEYPHDFADELELDLNLQPCRPTRKSSRKAKNLDEDQTVVNPNMHEHYYRNAEDRPPVPHGRQKSLQSLNAMSEHDSITGEINSYREIQTEMNQNQHEYQIPTPDQIPKRPFRTRSRTRSHSRGAAVPDEETLAKQSQTTSQQSINFNEEPRRIVNRDYMGYSTIDKSNISEPPLPPYRRRSIKSEGRDDDQDIRFFTVPRSNVHELPIRPLRNYSTLGPSRPPRKRSVPNMTDEEKNGSQYIEIEDEDHTKNLHSGAVISKMKDRPLPAPPRPPRRARDISGGSRKSEKSEEMRNDFGSQEHIELEMAMQTESLPELRQEFDDRRITSTKDTEDKYAKIVKPRNIQEFDHQETITHGSLIVKPFAHDDIIPDGPIEVYSKSTERIVTVKREANSDKGMDYDETSDIPEDFKKLQFPESLDQKVIERIIEKHIPIQLELPSEVETLKASKLHVSDLDVERLAVNELHASKITVGEIEGSSIVANEISSNSGNLVVSGIELPASFFQQLVDKLHEQAEHPASSKPDDEEIPRPPPRKVVETKESQTNTDPTTHTRQTNISQPFPYPTDDVLLPQYTPFMFDRPAEVTTFIYDSEEVLREQLASEIDDVILTAQSVIFALDDDDDVDQDGGDRAELGQKKTSIEVRLAEIENEPPQRPPRVSKEKKMQDLDASESEPTPPPRPPQPDPGCMQSSQPPTTFYGLRSPPEFKDIEIDDDIPLSPRRRRHHPHHHHHHHRVVLESSSEDTAPSKRRHRTSEPSISQLTGQLSRACLVASERSFRRLIQQITDNVRGHVEGKHELNVAVVILIVFIAMLLLIGWNGDGKQIHHHHWEYFNPPRDI